MMGAPARGLIRLASQENSLYGARFKSWAGGNGIARKCVEFPSVSSNGSDWIELVSLGRTSRSTKSDFL